MREVVRTELAVALQDWLSQSGGKATLGPAPSDMAGERSNGDKDFAPDPRMTPAAGTSRGSHGTHQDSRISEDQQDFEILKDIRGRLADLRESQGVSQDNITGSIQMCRDLPMQTRAGKDGVQGGDDDSLCTSSTNEDEMQTQMRTNVKRKFRRWRSFVGRFLKEFEEPQRSGRLARFVDSSDFDVFIGVVIFVNICFMVYEANIAIRNPLDRSTIAGDWVFLIIYCLELALKIAVHRLWFFCNADWKSNVLDAIVVISDFITLLMDTTLRISFFRALRFLKLGRVMRTLQVMRQFGCLRVFLVCIEGSVSTFFWSVVMLTSVYGIFALFFMQLITSHIENTPGASIHEPGDVLGKQFGSFESSVQTLFIVTTGGDDWLGTYEALEVTGWLGRCTFLFFVLFVQLNLMNIILGVFVDSAMKVLEPDPQMIAEEHDRLEDEHAEKLASLCKAVDTDHSGKLTQEQFEEGLRRKHIPKLLRMMGLQKHHIVEFFNILARASDDDGQVDIATFVNGCMMVKGASTNFELQKMHAEVKIAHTTMIKLMEEITIPCQAGAQASTYSSRSGGN
jgi:hypothetical protein